MLARRRLRYRTAWLGAALAGLAPALSRAQVHSRPSTELIGEILFDSARGLLVAPTQPHGIEAFEAATGKVVWSDSAADRLLALDGRRLLATLSSPLVEEFRVVVLNATDGSLLKEMPTAHLPPDVSGPRRLELQTRIHGDVASVTWTARRSILPGRPPPNGWVPPPDPHGVFWFQLAQGRRLPPPDPAVVAVPDSGPAAQEWTLVNGVEAKVDQGERRAVLKRRRKKRALPDVVLAQGLMASYPFSEDRRHVLGRIRIERPFRPDRGDLWGITVFETATGKRLASGRLEESPFPFLFVGGRLVYYHSPPDEIRGVDLTAGRTVYTRPVKIFHIGAPG